MFEDRSLQGLPYCHAHTDLIESWLAELWSYATEVADSQGLALVAIGGQGRREVAPFSDLDLLLLTAKDVAAEVVAEKLWYPIWDSGLKLGHSVRTVRDTLALAGEDLETATALLTARHLNGNPELTAELVEKAAGNWRKKGRKWLAELSESVKIRHASSSEVAFALEPDLKSGRGGLRDVHALTWAQAAGAELAPEVHESLLDPYAELTRFRVELHRAQARPGDRLLLQEQDNVASRLGFDDADALMRDVAAAGRSVAFASDEAWFDINAALSGSFFGRFRQVRVTEAGMAVDGGRVGMSPESMAEDPFASLRLAHAAIAEGGRISTDSLEDLSGAPDPADPWPSAARDLFTDLLLTGPAAIDVIETLDQAGQWERLIPEWTPTKSRPQRNAYHRFTVDRHLLETVAGAAGLAHRVHRPDLLVMGALLHDIAKAYPELGDHSQVGADMAEVIARRMGFGPEDVSTISEMVRLHLLFPDVATRRDLSDPATIEMVASKMSSPQMVALLAALTEADSLATGPSLWSPWKADLVELLAHRTGDVMGGVGELTPAAVGPFPRPAQRALLDSDGVEMITEGDRVTICCKDRAGVFYRAAGALVLHGLDVVEANIYSERGRALDEFKVRAGTSGAVPWDRVSADMEKALNGLLALHSRVDERVRSHMQRKGATVHQLPPAVRFDNESSSTSTVIELVGPDSPGLLYRVARSLAEFHLSVTGARIQTLGDDVIDAMYVSAEGGGKVDDPDLQSEIERALLHALEVPVQPLG